MRTGHLTAAVLIALVGAAAAATALRAAEPCPAQCASGKVPLGVSLPLSGTAAAFGKSTAKALEIAVAELNKAGGLLGVPVEPVAADDRCDAGTAATVAKRHADRNARYVIGSMCPAVVMDAARLYAASGTIQFVPTVTAVELTQRHPDVIFRMVANDEQEAKAVVSYLAREQPNKKLAVVFGEFFYRRAMAKMIDAALSAEQKKLTRLESLADVTGADDRLADRLKKTPPDIIYLSLDAEQAARFVGKLRERGIKSMLMGGQHLLSASFWLNHRSAAQGIYVVTPVASTQFPAVRKAIDLLRAADVTPDIVTLSNFAAVQTWAEAVRRAGSGDAKAVVAALRAGTFDTAVGPVAFDARGDRRDIEYSILSWKNGRLAPGVP